MRNYLTAVLVLFLWLTHGTAQAANMNITVGPNNSETFSPANVTINVGDTITFSYKGGSMPHNAVSKNLFRCAQGCDGAGGDGDASSSSWTSVVTLTTAGTFNYYCEIHGTPTSGMHGTITVNGSAPPPPDFGVSADTPSVSVTQGASATVGVTLAPQNGFNGNVSYAASGLPSGVVASFVNDSATHATMTLASNSSATPGNATVTITATSGSLVHSTSVALSVLASSPTFCHFRSSVPRSVARVDQEIERPSGVSFAPHFWTPVVPSPAVRRMIVSTNGNDPSLSLRVPAWSSAVR